MSQRVEKLRALLGRVEERRAQPRLHKVPAQFSPALPSNQAAVAERVSAAPDLRGPGAPVVERVSAVPERQAKPPAPTPLEGAIAHLSPAARDAAPTPVPGQLQPSSDLVLDDLDPPMARAKAAPQPAVSAPTARLSRPVLEPPTKVVSKIPPEPAADLFASDPFAPSVPPGPPSSPPTAVVPAAPAVPAPLTSPTARVAPPEMSASAPVARAVSPARVESPKTFGELVERTLALRPARD
jgi:DNA polymerase-3 subunit gamma/tau